MASSPPAFAENQPPEQYLLHGSGCHGTSPSLHDLAAVLEALGGREYLARVPGIAQAPLDDADLARLPNWVLTERSGATMRTPYSPSKIGNLCALPLRDPTAARPNATSPRC